MPENKTKATGSSVDAYLAAIESESRRADCAELIRLMSKVTRQQPQMWGSSIVGFGSYRYRYASGHSGDSCLIGFSSRKTDISIYLAEEFPGRDEGLARLGKFKVGKACLYVKSLAQVDLAVLGELIVGSVTKNRSAHRD